MKRWVCWDQEYPDEGSVVVYAEREELARDLAVIEMGYDHDDRDWIVVEQQDEHRDASPPPR